MKKFGKKALSLIVASAMVFTLLPATAAAKEKGAGSTVSNVVGFFISKTASTGKNTNKNENGLAPENNSGKGHKNDKNKNDNENTGSVESGSDTAREEDNKAEDPKAGDALSQGQEADEEQKTEVDETKGIVFKFYADSDSGVSVGIQNGVKFTVDLIDEKGKNVPLTPEQIASIPEEISFAENYVPITADTFAAIDLEGYTFSKATAYFYWEGDFKGTKYAAYSFTNFARDPGYATSNFIGYTSEYNSVGDGTFGEDSTGTGTFWYQENGTLHVVFHKVLPNAPKTVYHVNDAEKTVYMENDTVEWINRKYIYYPVDKTAAYDEAYMESHFESDKEFMGWFEDAACTTPVTEAFFDKQTDKDVHVYAKWVSREHSVEYSWTGLPQEMLYDAEGNVVVPELPEAITGLKRGETYTVDTTYTSQTVFYTKDEYGNNNNEVRFSGWTDPSNAHMDKEDVPVTGTWTVTEIEVPTWHVTYSWNSTPEGTALPVDTKEYVNNEEVVLDTTYTAGMTIDTYDAYGNVNGTYVFSGWSAVGKIRKDETITGTWDFTPKRVNRHTVTYVWDGDVPMGETLPEGGSYVKNQPYTIDSKYAENYTVNETSLFGNLKGQYVFSGWSLQGEQIMGKADVTVTGTWTYKADPEYKLYNVTYSWSGLPDETLYDENGAIVVPELPASATGLEKSQAYTIDTKKTGMVVYTHAENGNVNASYTLGSWDKEDGIIAGSNVEVSAEWTKKNAVYTITIHFVDEETGDPIADDYTETFEVGSDFDFTVPAVPGYEPEYDVIRQPDGSMPAEDVEITISYTKDEPVTPPAEEESTKQETTKADETTTSQETTKADETTMSQETTKADETTMSQETTKADETTAAEATEAPENEAEAGDEADAADGTEAVEENDIPESEAVNQAEEDKGDDLTVGTFVKQEDGSYDMTELEEEETPAGLLDLGHKDCILHFLFAFIAMMTLFFYADSRRKNQEKILELKKTLSEAEKKSSKGGKK